MLISGQLNDAKRVPNCRRCWATVKRRSLWCMVAAQKGRAISLRTTINTCRPPC
ncbi:hypothetical protein KCP70_15630 [Salmonella enterica subsp. enterica]|nr:hypothetical protein KCP70_15630 [Salmonella enterica subsp. enterica]